MPHRKRRGVTTATAFTAKVLASPQGGPKLVLHPSPSLAAPPSPVLLDDNSLVPTSKKLPKKKPQSKSLQSQSKTKNVVRWTGSTKNAPGTGNPPTDDDSKSTPKAEPSKKAPSVNKGGDEKQNADKKSGDMEKPKKKKDCTKQEWDALLKKQKKTYDERRAKLAEEKRIGVERSKKEAEERKKREDKEDEELWGGSGVDGIANVLNRLTELLEKYPNPDADAECELLACLDQLPWALTMEARDDGKLAAFGRKLARASYKHPDAKHWPRWQDVRKLWDTLINIDNFGCRADNEPYIHFRYHQLCV